MFEKLRHAAVVVLGVVLCLFTLVFANYPVLKPQSSLALFVLLGLVLCFLTYPVSKRFAQVRWLARLDVRLGVRRGHLLRLCVCANRADVCLALAG